MDLGLRSSAYHEVQDESYDGREYEVELAEVPKSRAPSYASTSKNVDWKDSYDNSDGRPLIRHARSSLSGFDLKDGVQTAFRLINTPSFASSNREKKRKLQGWHFGVTLAALTASGVLVLNVIFTIVICLKFGTTGGVGTAYDGSCDYVNNVTTWLHVIINALSSLLLSASNYTMQALSAPTRQEVDRAHSKGDWMDIGVASVRNLFKIRWQRVVAWWILAMSSVPIHLLYNSAIFKTIDTNQYWVVVANEQWLKGGNYSLEIPWEGHPPGNNDGLGYNVSIPYEHGYLKDLRNLFGNATAHWNSTAFRNMSNAECIQTYGQNFVSGFNHVLAISSEEGTFDNETMFFMDQSQGAQSFSPDYWWICASDFNASTSLKCDTKKIKKDASAWTINGKKIDYCISQVVPAHCTIGFSLQVLIAVIVCNVLKSLAMFWTLYKQKDSTLVTIGDAVASYLDNPDDTTKGRCLMSRTDITGWKLEGTENKPNTEPLPKTFFEQNYSRWFGAASAKRWVTTFMLILIAIIVSLFLLSLGVQNLSPLNPFSIGFGAIDSRALIGTYFPSKGGGLVSAILLANCPQAIVSFLYLLYNGLLTSMLLAKEWSSYALRRKGLRVTSPHGSQRATYYLQLPLRYSAPLLIISATLHWVISQSIFLALIDQYIDGKKSNFDSITQVGYSCPPIILAISIGILLSAVAIGMGFQKFKSQMPVASSCSVAIAAACHRPKDDVDAAFLPVMWGEVRGGGLEEMGHCCFTSLDVEPLVPGRMYAGHGVEVEEGSIRKRRMGAADV